MAISRCTRRDISELGEIDASRIDVIYQSCAPRFNEEPQARKMWQVRDKYELPDRYVLNVGSIEERENVMLAVTLATCPTTCRWSSWDDRQPYSDRCTSMCWNTACTDGLQMLHNVPDDDLPALYRMADAFVYPSRYEGFGIPIIEAISQGLPVVACSISMPGGSRRTRQPLCRPRRPRGHGTRHQPRALRSTRAPAAHRA